MTHSARFEPHLHWSFQDEHILFPFVVLHSVGGFLGACLMVFIICLSERFLSVALDKQWSPHIFKLSRRRLALWRTLLYSIVTFLRLCYMLVSMSFHVGLVLMIIFTLSLAQFFIELDNLPKPAHLPRTSESAAQPLLTSEQHHSLDSIKTHSRRSRSKPENIFIHPAESNIARADAAALELGVGGETERVQAYRPYNDDTQSSWGHGKSKDMAREMLLGMGQNNVRPHQHKPPARDPFYIGGDTDSDTE